MILLITSWLFLYFFAFAVVYRMFRDYYYLKGLTYAIVVASLSALLFVLSLYFITTIRIL